MSHSSSEVVAIIHYLLVVTLNPESQHCASLYLHSISASLFTSTSVPTSSTADLRPGTIWSEITKTKLTLEELRDSAMTSRDQNVIVSHFHEYAMRGGDVTNDMFQKYFKALERYERLPRNCDKRLDSYASPSDQELMYGPFGHTRTFPELHQAFQTNTPGIWATVVNTMGPLVISGLVDVAGLYFRYKEGAQIKAQEAENKASEYRLKMVGTIVGTFSWMMGN